MPRKQIPSRFRQARSDASIASVQAEIAKKYNLPRDAVRLISPTGRKMRADATVGRLRKRWD